MCSSQRLYNVSCHAHSSTPLPHPHPTHVPPPSLPPSTSPSPAPPGDRVVFGLAKVLQPIDKFALYFLCVLVLNFTEQRGSSGFGGLGFESQWGT